MSCLSSLNCLTLLFFTSLGVGLYLHWSPSMCLAHSSAVSLFDVSNDLVVSLDRWLDGRALWNEMIIRNLLEGCDVASKIPIRFPAGLSGVIRKYRMYGVLGHLGFCLWLRHPRWPQWCVAACYVRSVSMRVWCEITTGAVVVLLMLCYGRAPLFTGFPLGKSQLTIERCLALTNHFAQLC